MRTQIRKSENGCDEYFVEMDSVEDLYNNEELVPGKGNSSGFHRQKSLGNYQQGFVGASFSDVVSRKWGWKEGGERAKELAELELPPKGDKFQKVWSDDDGDDGDMERYLMEMPFLSRRKKVFDEKAVKMKTIKVRACISENCNVSAEQMFYKCATIVRVVDELEAMGTRCEVQAEVKIKNDFTMNNETGMHLVIPLKSADEPLNISMIAHAVSPYFFRTHIFQFLYANFMASSYLGRSLGITKMSADEVVINNGQCLSKEDANKFIENLKIGG